MLDLDGLDIGQFDQVDATWLDKCNRLIYKGTGVKIHNNLKFNYFANACFVTAALGGC